MERERRSAGRLAFQVVLLAVLLALSIWRLAGGIGNLSFGSGSAAEAGCAAGSVPAVLEVDRDRLLRLREDVLWVVSPWERLVAYEQGPVGVEVAWSDGEPGWNPVPAADAALPGGYEMRWWLPNRDDVVADAWLFADSARAREFVAHAAGGGCRTSAIARSAPFPGGGRNLAWTNPDGFAQEDVFFASGSVAYRVSVVRAGVGTHAGAAARRRGFDTVDRLACLLPGADCSPRQEGPPLT